MEVIERHQTAVLRLGRTARLEMRRRAVGRSQGDFIPLPVTTQSWLIVKTNPQCEARAVEALMAVGIPAYAPVYRKRLFDPRSGRRIFRTTPFMVGYVFAQVDPDSPLYGLLRDSDGVAGVLPLTPEAPAFVIPDREIEVLRRMEATHWLEQDKAFRARAKKFRKGKGSKPVDVAPTHSIGLGAFEGFLASIIRMEPRRTARVVTQVFGQPHEIVVPLDGLVQAA